MKRSDFLTKDDFEEARALVRMAKLAVKHGATADEVIKALGPRHWFNPAIVSHLNTKETP